MCSFYKMALLYLLCALFVTTQTQCLPLTTPLLSPCPPVIPPCPSVVAPCPPVVAPCPPVVSPCQPQVIASTIIDNSVSNALANALQLLIVSNLIENTMNSPCGCNTLPNTIGPICDAIPIQASVYSPGIDVITPDYFPYVPFDPIPITPCDIIAPCDPIIDFIPNNCYPDVIPIPNIGCGCGCGCGCDGPFIPNIGNIGPNFGCGNCYPSLKNILPSILPGIGLPNIGCGCNNFGYDVNPFGSVCGCDSCGPFVPDIMFPPAIPAQVGYNYGYGVPNFPIGVTVEPCYGGWY